MDLFDWKPPEDNGLRDYQQQAADTGKAFFEREYDGRNEVLVCPTGSGKSHIISDIAKDATKPTIIFQPSQEILEQNYKKIKRAGVKEIGIYSAAFNSKSVRSVTLATIGSVYKNPELFKGFQIIVDEADGINPEESMYKSFIDALDQPVLGLTATPWRLTRGHLVGIGKRKDGGEYKKYSGAQNTIITRTEPRVFHDLSHVTQIQELYKRGYLGKLEYVEGYFDQEKLALNRSGSEFTAATFKRISSNVVRDAFYAARRKDGKHTLIFTSLIEEAEKVADMLDTSGISCAVVTGKTHEAKRSAIDTRFRSGELDVVVNVGCWTVGYDFPGLDHIINGRLTNSARLYYQILGRGMRVDEGKDFCLVTDLCGNVDRFGKVENWEIVNENGWRLKSGDKYLTGVDLKTGEDQENKASEGKKVSFDKGTTWPVGKYKDYPLEAIRTDYFIWFRDNSGPSTARKMAICELERRGVSV